MISVCLISVFTYIPGLKASDLGIKVEKQKWVESFQRVNYYSLDQDSLNIEGYNNILLTEEYASVDSEKSKNRYLIKYTSNDAEITVYKSKTEILLKSNIKTQVSDLLQIIASEGCESYLKNNEYYYNTLSNNDQKYHNVDL